MTLIMAGIKPCKLGERSHAARRAGPHVTEVKRLGRQEGQTEIHRGAECQISHLPKVKIEVAVSDDLADGVMVAITRAAGTDNIGDGEIFEFDVERAKRIRTGATDIAAL